MCTDGIRGGLPGLGVSPRIDRAVPVFPQVAGKYENMVVVMVGGHTAKYSVTMSCAFVVPVGFVCNMGIFLLETRREKKNLSPGSIFHHPSLLPTTYLVDLLQAMLYYLWESSCNLGLTVKTNHSV